MPCGICGGCLLRRTAVHAAGFSDGAYFWGDLSSESLDDCRSNPNGRKYLPSDVDIGVHGIYDMSRFADVARDGVEEDLFERSAWEIVGKPSGKLSDRKSVVEGRRVSVRVDL